MEEIRKCMIVDDDEDDQEIFKMCLKAVNKDIHCVSAYDGQEAIDMLASNPELAPHFIFLDVNMPKMNGIECLRILQKIPSLRNTKIFIYSTTAEKSALEESKKLGATDYIVKPSKTSVLKEKLGNIFKIVSEINNKRP